MIYDGVITKPPLDEIYHHGIQGQKWGVRNGPPYPLDSSKSTGSKLKNSNITIGKKKTLEERRKGSNREGYITLASLGIDILTLNLVDFAQDATRMTKAAVARVKEKNTNKRISKLKSSENVDKDLGFALKKKKFTEEQDVAQVNPGYKNFNSNTKNNCMLCTCTYELRRRGYDVTANKAGAGYTHSDLKKWFKDVEIKEAYSMHGSKKEITKANLTTYFNKNKEAAKEILKVFEKEPNGSRGNLMVYWSLGSGGHSVAYEIKDNKLVLRDCQDGKIYKDPSKLLSKCIGADYARLDNLKINKKGIKEVCH